MLTVIFLIIVCIHALLYILVIAPLAPAKPFMLFLPQDTRMAAKGHPDPSSDRRLIGYLSTAVGLETYLGALALPCADGLQHGYGFRPLSERFLRHLCPDEKAGAV